MCQASPINETPPKRFFTRSCSPNTHTLTHSITLPLSRDTSGTERAQSVALCADARVFVGSCLHSTPPAAPAQVAVPLQQRRSYGAGGGGGGGGDGRGEEEEDGVFGQGTVRGGGGRWGRREVSAFVFVSVFFFVFCFFWLITLMVKRVRTSSQLRWRRAKSPPHGSRRHAHAQLHAGRSRWHVDLIQLR